MRWPLFILKGAVFSLLNSSLLLNVYNALQYPWRIQSVKGVLMITE